VQEHRLPDLARCYSLFSRVQGLYTLKASFNAYIKKTGLEKASPPGLATPLPVAPQPSRVEVSDAEKEETLVQELSPFSSSSPSKAPYLTS
jgi:hypothetical protein